MRNISSHLPVTVLRIFPQTRAFRTLKLRERCGHPDFVVYPSLTKRTLGSTIRKQSRFTGLHPNLCSPIGGDPHSSTRKSYSSSPAAGATHEGITPDPSQAMRTTRLETVVHLAVFETVCLAPHCPTRHAQNCWSKSSLPSRRGTHGHDSPIGICRVADEPPPL